MRTGRALRWLVLAALLLIGTSASAHKESDAYLTLRTDSDNAHVLRGQWDIALSDLNFAVGIDSNHDGAITWGEVKAHRHVIERYALSRLAIRGDGLACELDPTAQKIDAHTDGAYNVLFFRAVCDRNIPNKLTIDYRLFADIDPYHRGIVTVRADDRTAGAVLGPDHAAAQINLRQPDRWRQFVTFMVDGIWHIWGGIDHILFVLSLLLPSVLILTSRRDAATAAPRGLTWLPVASLWPALIETVKIVTAFTVSHSITLTLAVLGIVDLPSRLVESGIALSIVLAALNNVYPVVHRRIWLLAFGFGFVHGLGFASALSGLSLPAGAMAASLGGFNIGVEIGQEVVVLLFMPFAFLLRRTRFYRQFLLRWGSVAIAVVAMIWLIERAFNVVIPWVGVLLPR